MAKNRSGLNRGTPHVNTAGSPRRKGQGSSTTALPGHKTIKSKGAGPAVKADSGHFNKIASGDGETKGA